MSIYSKIKIGIILISAVLILFVHLFDKGFYRQPIFKKWGQLTWTDFDGMVKPFIESSARISFDIHVKYNEENREYSSYSIQNNIFSWKIKDVENDDILLRHEQYHFNITEYHSRLLNKYFKNNSPQNEYDYKPILDSIIKENKKMQTQYDKKTEHSINIKEQLIWENRIDSLLKEESSNKHFTHELLTKNNYKKRWVNLINNDTIGAKVELYISESKDSIWNQILIYKNKKVDTLNSILYNLNISNSMEKNIYNGKLKIYSNYDDLTLQNSKNRIIEFTYFEQNKDSIWVSNIASNSLNPIEFSFQNYYNNKIHGIVLETIQTDTITFHRDSIYTRYILIDNKFNTSDTFVNDYELKEEKKVFF